MEDKHGAADYYTNAYYVQPLRPCGVASDYMCLSKVRAVKRLYYGLGRNSVLFNVGQSSSSHFFFLPSGLFAQNYYHIVSYNALAIKLY